MIKMTKNLQQVQLLLVILCANPTLNMGLARLTNETISGKHFVVSGISVRKLRFLLLKRCKLLQYE